MDNQGMVYYLGPIYGGRRNIFKAKGYRGHGHQVWVWSKGEMGHTYPNWQKAYANRLPAKAKQIKKEEVQGYFPA